MKKFTKIRVFLFVCGFARPHLPLLGIGMLLYVSQRVMFPLIDSVLMGGITAAMLRMDFRELFMAGFRTLSLLVLAMILVWPGVLMYVAGANKTKLRLQKKIIRAFMNADTEKRAHSGERLSALNTDVNYAHDLYSNAIANLLNCLVPIIALSAAVFAAEWRLGLYTLFAGLFSMAGQTLFAKPLAKIAECKLVKTSGAVRTLGDIFACGVIARVFDLRRGLLEVFGRDNDEIRRLIYREAKVNGAQALFSGISSLLTTGGMFVAGSILISRAELTLPALMAIVPMCSSVAVGISNIGSAWAGMQTPLEAGRRVYELVGGDNRLEPLSQKEGLSPVENYELEVKNLTFSFHDTEKPLFQNVSLTVRENGFAAFTGGSGGGKSTLLKVIAGIYERDDINITVGNRKISEIGIDRWRGFFSYVDQSCTLFNLTVAENIAIGKEGATEDEIRAAALDANADAFITALPLGYDTPVGEAGVNLSGGQRQRIAIARALIRRSPILVFDEATSALDRESEQEVIETVNHLRNKHTILMVTHNLSSIKPDVTFKVEGGRVTVL